MGKNFIVLREKALRNEIFVRLNDAQLASLEAQRGDEPHSAYIRRLVEREVQRDLQGKGGSDEAA